MEAQADGWHAGGPHDIVGRFTSRMRTFQEGRAQDPWDEIMSEFFQKWIPEICTALSDGSFLRYGQIQTRVANIGSKTLARKLRLLCSMGLLERRSYDEIPPRVEYALTERGKQFTQRLVDAYDLASVAQAAAPNRASAAARA